MIGEGGAGGLVQGMRAGDHDSAQGPWFSTNTKELHIHSHTQSPRLIVVVLHRHRIPFLEVSRNSRNLRTQEKLASLCTETQSVHHSYFA